MLLCTYVKRVFWYNAIIKKLRGESMSADTIHKLVIIASSTGGPKALHRVIPSLPKRLDAPVIIVQHMPKGFTATLAERLNNTSEIDVCEATDGEIIQKGKVYIAKGGTHLTLVRDAEGDIRVREDFSDPVNGLRPCADITFSSIADLKVKEIICAVLTGMGSDGSTGIYHLREQQKIYTIAQQKETCVVYGMPKAVVERGMADIVLPLEEIATKITKKVGVF